VRKNGSSPFGPDGRVAATIKRYVATIARVLVAARLLNPCSSEAVRLGLKKMGRETSARQDQAHPSGWKDIKEGNQSSSLTMRLVNGRDILGTPNSILTLVRLDDTLERTRTFHLGIPLPKKAHSEIRIMTDTETKMIQELERSIQTKSVEAIWT
jgi:hypothetical protein